jgi:hypothetical protein
MNSENITLHKSIDRELFLKLSDVHDEHCISIYINTDDPEKAQIRLKNQLSEAESILESEYELKKRPISEKLDPIREKLEDPYFWRQGKKGLAVFSFENNTRFILTNEPLDTRTYIADHLYLLPLAPMASYTQSALLMTLSAQDVRLFEVDQNAIEESPISEKLPKRISEIVGEDVEQKSLQFRSGQEGTGKAMFHGQGSGSEEEQKTEYREFFQAIDKELTNHFKEQKIPLILGGVDYLIPLYREISDYNNIYHKSIKGNFDRAKPHEIHDKVKPMLIQMHQELTDQLSKQYDENLGHEKASYKAEEVVPAAINGKLEALFIREGEDIHGKYELSTNRIEVDEGRAINNSSLYNMAARHTVKNNGYVFVLPKERMPDQDAAICGIYRYSI